MTRKRTEKDYDDRPMSNDKVVRGWAGPNRTRLLEKAGLFTVGKVQVLDDDEPVVIVPADLWERVEKDHRAMEKLRAERGDCFHAHGIVGLWGYSPDPYESVSEAPDPADAILGEAP